MKIEFRFNIYGLFEKYWLILPALSALLLVLSFYPFDFWFLSPVALVPLFYFINFSGNISVKKIFSAGFFVGSVFSVALSYFTLIQFHWLPETYLFVWMIRLLFIPVAAFSGLVAGAAVVLSQKIKRHYLIDIFSGAAVWTLAEWLVNKIFSGYHFGLLGYTMHKVTPLINLASIGGVFFISFVVVLFNTFIAAILLWPKYEILYPRSYKKDIALLQVKTPFKKFFISTRKVFLAAFISIAATFIIYEINSFFLNGKGVASRAGFAVIQNKDRQNEAFGKFENGEFEFKKLEALIKYADNLKPDFIIYPFSPFVGLLSEQETPEVNFNKEAVVGNFNNLGKWGKKIISPKTTLITWNNVLRGKIPYNEVDFWRNSEMPAHYQKRELFPFMDYTPEFMQFFGLYTTPLDVFPGEKNQIVEIGGVKFGNLLCSEINRSDLAAYDSRNADILLAIGSEAMFVDSTAGNFHLVAAQFRAAETNRPLIRANRLGPSAVISERGEIIKKLGFEKDGLIYENVIYKKNAPRTLYSYAGNYGFIGTLLLFLGLISLKNFRKQQTS